MLLAALLFSAGSSLARANLTLAPDQVRWLAETTRRDRDAWAEMRWLRSVAAEALRARPEPIKRLGKARSQDARRVFALAMTWAVWGGDVYAKKAREILLAWASTNEPQGNSIRDAHLEQLLLGYDLLRPETLVAERGKIDGWLRALADAELYGPRPVSFDAENAQRIKNVGMIGLLLEDDRLVGYATKAFLAQLAHRFEGLDEHHRLYALEALLTFARVARLNGIELYEYHPPETLSLRQIAELYLRGYSAELANALILDSFFEVSREKPYRELMHRKRQRYAGWQSLLFAAERQGPAWSRGRYAGWPLRGPTAP